MDSSPEFRQGSPPREPDDDDMNEKPHRSSRRSSETSVRDSMQEPASNPTIDEKSRISRDGSQYQPADEERRGPAGADSNDPERGSPAVVVTVSRTPSVASQAIPRAQRRGLFGRFGILPEVERPYEYPNKVKWFITFIVALAGAGAPVGSSLIWRMYTCTHTHNSQARIPWANQHARCSCHE